MVLFPWYSLSTFPAVLGTSIHLKMDQVFPQWLNSSCSSEGRGIFYLSLYLMAPREVWPLRTGRKDGGGGGENNFLLLRLCTDNCVMCFKIVDSCNLYYSTLR